MLNQSIKPQRLETLQPLCCSICFSIIIRSWFTIPGGVPQLWDPLYYFLLTADGEQQYSANRMISVQCWEVTSYM